MTPEGLRSFGVMYKTWTNDISAIQNRPFVREIHSTCYCFIIDPEITIPA